MPRSIGFLFGVFLCVTVWSSIGRAQPIGYFLEQGDFDRLEQIYTAGAQEAATCGILVSPKLADFFSQLSPNNDSERFYAERVRLAEAWLEQRPESAAAYLSLVQILYHQAWLPRSALNRDNSHREEAMAEFWRRLERPLAMVESPPAGLPRDVAFHFVAAYVFAPYPQKQDKMLAEVDAIRAINPRFWPIYERAGYYRMVGFHDGLGAFARKWADELGGVDGDIVYARLMGYAASHYGDGFVEKYSADLPRVIRGYLAALEALPEKSKLRRLLVKRFQQAAKYSQDPATLAAVQPFAPGGGSGGATEAGVE